MNKGSEQSHVGRLPMKAILRVLVFSCLLVGLARGTSAQVLLNYQCDPLSCNISMGPVLNGVVELSIDGDCSTSLPVSRLETASATACSSPVLVSITGTIVTVSRVEDCFRNNVDGVRVDAFWYKEPNLSVPVFSLWSEEWCDGGVGGDEMGTAPC